MEEEEQSDDRAIYARYGNRMQVMTQKELRLLMEKNSGKYVVYDGKTTRSIKESYNCPHRRQNVGRRKKEGPEEAKQKRNNKFFRK